MTKRHSRLTVFLDRQEQCRRNEKAEAVLLAAQDNQLVRLILAWERIPVRRKRRLSDPPENGSDREHWAWLWENMSYSIDDLAAASGLPSEAVASKMAVLQANRLVHPDGTINRYVAQYLKTKVLSLFRVKSLTSPNPKTLAKGKCG